MVNAAIRAFFHVLLSPFAGRPVFLSLVPISALFGLAVLFAFELLSNRTAIAATRRRLWAHLLAIGLYAEELAVVGESALGVIQENARLLLYSVPALLVLTPVIALLFSHLDSFYGSSTLRPGSPAVLTVRLRDVRNGWPKLDLRAPAWIAIDIPPIHVAATNEVSWRIRALRTNRGSVTITAGTESVTKEIDSRPGPQYFSDVRAQSGLTALHYPAEPILPDGDITGVEITPMQRSSADWVWWFALFSMLLGPPLLWAGRRMI